MKLVDIAIKRPVLIIVHFILLILGGLYSYTSFGYELIPRFSQNTINITTVYPGASPGEIENTVTKKIEDGISSLENIKKVESKSLEGVSIVTVALTSDADVDYSLNDAQRTVNAILKDLPEDTDPPSLTKVSLSDLPVVTLSASAKMDESAF